MRLKQSHRKITMTHTQTTCPNRVLLRLEPRPQCWKISYRAQTKTKINKCKHTIQIATFNVRTLNRIGQQPELTASAIYHNIICIQEHKYIHSEDIKYHDTGNGWTFVTASAWKNSVNATIEGVGMLIGPRALKSQNSIEKIQPRMATPAQQSSPAKTLPMKLTSSPFITSYPPLFVAS